LGTNPGDKPGVQSHPVGDYAKNLGTVHRFADWLFSNPTDPGSPKAVVAWWEARRPSFNLIVGAYGVIGLVAFLVTISASGHLQPGEDAVEPLALFAAPIVINVLYTLGWIVELTYRSLEPDLSPRFGPRLLQLGLGLGLFLSTVPAAVQLLQWSGIAL
jgi:hypothetical protein